jgi:D-glycero-D-manno-heptose 1,7-bisphosphate phosphatase
MEALARMSSAGLTLIVITNQRGIALGRMTVQDLEAIHLQMRADLARVGGRLDAIYYCPHDKNQCDCRKPGIGLFQQAMRDFPQIDAANSVVIGDSLSDIEAGRKLGMRTIFINGDPAVQKPGASHAAALADSVAGSLLEAVKLFEP